MNRPISFFRNVRYEIERMLFWCVVRAAKILPHGALLAAGRFFGSFAYFADARHRQVALDNVQLAMPETSKSEAKKIVRNCYRFFGASLFDILSSFPELNRAKMDDFEYEGLEHVEAAYAKGKGAIFFTAHWGGWEQMGVAHGAKGHPMGLVARTLDNPYLDAALERFRRSTGNFLIDKNNGIRPMFRALREGKGLAILIDQSVSSGDRIFVKFFGHTAATTPILGYLKLRTDASLIPSFALPLPKGRYRFIYSAPVEVTLTGDRKQDVWEITQVCTQAIEEQIRRYPDFWLWMHNRWKMNRQGAKEEWEGSSNYEKSDLY